MDDPAIREAAARARTAWPGVAVPEERFLDHLRKAARGADGGAGALHAGDLYLAFACAEGDPRALEVLEDRYLSTLPAVLAATRAPPEVAEEVGQILRMRLLVRQGPQPGKIAQYSGRGPLEGWIRVAIVRTALSLRRTDVAREHRRGEGPPPGLAMVDPEMAIIQRRYAAEFNGALRRAFRELSPEERTVLRLHFVDGLNLGAIARVIGGSRATAGRRVLSARSRLHDETLRLLRGELGLDESELRSLLALVRSKLDISLRSALANAPG